MKMPKKKTKEKLDKKFIQKHQGKYFCKCPCKKEIIILTQHRIYGIPKYIYGHNLKEFMNRPEEKEKISKRIIKLYKDPKERERVSRQSAEFFSNPTERERVSKRSKEFQNRPEEKERVSKQKIKWWQIPENKNLMKERRKTQILPVKDTSIEIKIQSFLKQLGIEYFTHQYMKIKHGYQCDILIPVMNLVIECDGDYWHKYPVGNDIDHVRTKELIKKGFKVLRLWEFEINAMAINEFEKRLRC